ncbi:MAG: class I SAM-dependent methyltransferase, partial [bacterium]
MTKKVFGAYAKYYDLLYKDKNYNKEAAYIERIIKKFNPECKSILNLGCGTGKHDFIFADKGFDVTGIDLSKEMVQYANDSLLNRQSAGRLKFLQGDIREISVNRKFDAVIALFHVMSYQNTNDDILKTLIN